MKTIVLAEKPSVGREISRVMGCNNTSRTHCEGKDYIVTWAMGHLVELANPADYDQKWKSWNLDYLPMLPERMSHKVIPRTSQQFRIIKSLFNRKDVNNLIIATDAGREGELVARWIMRLGGWKGSFKRLWISSQTDTAIREGFNNLKPGHDYDNLLYAAESRAEADWIVGLNVTRALCCKYDARLSAGRVQTPTLAMIIDREKERQNFTPKAYWNIHADFENFKGVWQDNNGNTRISDFSHANKIATSIENKNGIISDITIKEKKELPPLAYDLTSLQCDANAVLGFSAKKTLQTLQALYERHKIVTYPRTDSRHITTDMVPTLPDRLKALAGTRYKATAEKLLADGLNTDKRLVDNNKVSDHHALLPTEETVNLQKLSSDEKSLWDLVIKRFLAVLSPPYLYKSISLKAEVEGEIFLARGISVINHGWKKIAGKMLSENSEENELLQNLSSLKKGEKIKVKKVNIPQSFTKPPSRYTEGTLLAAMENPSKFVSDDTLKKSIKKGGLGTPATRADIIEKLFSNYYMQRNGKEIEPTVLGTALINIVPEQLRSPDLTAKWEMHLTGIAEGKEKSKDFTTDIRTNTKELVKLVKDSNLKYQPRIEGNKICPMCSKKMLKVKDKKGKEITVCPSRSCGYEETGFDKNGRRGKVSKKERGITNRLMHKYGAKKEETYTLSLGDALKAQLAEKNKKK